MSRPCRKRCSAFDASAMRTLRIILLLSSLKLSEAELLVYPKILQSRSESGSFLLHIHDDLHLHLEKSSILAKDFSFRTIDNGSHEVLLNGEELERNLYHDSRLQSSVIVKQLKDAVEVHGILNHELRIAPVARAKRSTDGATLHRVFKVKERMNDPPKPIRLVPRQLRSFWPQMQPSYDLMSQGAGVFVGEVCVVAGRTYAMAFQSTQAMIEYFAIMLNAVALRYADMVQPRIGFQLNGVTTDQGDRLLAYTQGGVDITQTLRILKEYLKLQDFSACDFVFLFTEKEFVTVKDQKVDKSVTGLAYVGGVCGPDKVAVGEDKPLSYDGTYIWAHEMGHTLGATHDGDPRVRYIPNHPSAEGCSWEAGFLMSYEEGGRRKYTLSECSKRQIQAVYRILSQSCIQVRHQAVLKPSHYPGHTLTDTSFCKLMHPNNPGVFPYNRNNQEYFKCKLECCWVTGRGGSRISYLCKKYSFPEAMMCGPGMTCLRGVCGVHNWGTPYGNSYG